MPLTDIRLTGSLADVVGRDLLELDVASPIEAVHALVVMFPGARVAIEAHDWRIAVGARMVMDERHLVAPGRGAPITLYALPQGAGKKKKKSKGVGKIIGGILLIALSIVAPVIPWQIGAAVLLGGVSSLLAPSPKTNYANKEKPAERPSFLFHGAINAIEVGHPIPLVYGRTLTGSVVVSASTYPFQVGLPVFYQEIPPSTADPYDSGGPRGLRSVDKAVVVDVVSEGEVSQIVSVWMDGVRAALTGSSTTQLISRRGLPYGDADQGRVVFLRGTEEEVPVGKVITTTAAESARTANVPNSDTADTIRITMGFPQGLFTLDEDATEIDEYRKEAIVQFEVDIKKFGGSFVTASFGARALDDSGVYGAFPNPTEDDVIAFNLRGLYEIQTHEGGPILHAVWARLGYRPVSGGAYTYTEWLETYQEELLGARPLHAVDIPTVQPGTADSWEWVLEFQDRNGTLDASSANITEFALVGNRYLDTAYLQVRGIANGTDFERSWSVPVVPGEGPWDIRITRLTEDPDGVEVVSEMSWNSYTVVSRETLSYPDIAYAATQFSAQDYEGRIPRRAYDVKGIKVQVPTGYDELTRTYPGTWNGMFKDDKEWSDNSAWVLYDILTNQRYGMGLDADSVDKWSLYECSRYCDDALLDEETGRHYGMLPMGVLGTSAMHPEPRFSFNGVINTREEPIKILAAIASSMRVQIWWGTDGKVYFTQDRPADPVRLFNASNVVDGEFTYSGSPKRSRVSVVNVTWHDKDDGYRDSVESVENRDLIARYGYVNHDVTAYGCTNIWEAARRGRWELDTILNQSEAVAFSIGKRDGALIPGDIVSVQDPDYAGVRFGGRVWIGTTGAVVVDGEAILLEIGKTYKLTVQLPDDKVETRDITNLLGSPHISLTVSPVFSAAPLTGAAWVLTASDLAPRQFRVLSVSEGDDGTYDIAAALHDPGKFDRVEYDAPQIDRTPTIVEPRGPLPAPTSLTPVAFVVKGSVETYSAHVDLTWLDVDDVRVRFFEVRWREVGGVWAQTAITSSLHYRVTYLANGATYEFAVRSVDGTQSARSEWLAVTQLVNPLDAAPADVTGLVIGEDVDKSQLLTWDANTELHILGYELRTSAAASTAFPGAGGGAFVVQPADVTENPLVSYRIDLPRAMYWQVKAVSKTGARSVNHVQVLATDGGDYTELDDLDMESTWNGTHTDTEIVAFWLRLQADAGIYRDDGTFVSDSVTDLGSVKDVLLTANVYADGYRADYVMDAWVPLAAAEPLDGVLDTGWASWVEIRTAEVASPSGSDWTVWHPIGHRYFRARHIEARVQLRSLDGGITTPSISKVRIYADVET